MTAGKGRNGGGRDPADAMPANREGPAGEWRTFRSVGPAMIPRMRSDETVLAVGLPPGAEHEKENFFSQIRPHYGMSAHSIYGYCIKSALRTRDRKSKRLNSSH